METDSHRVAFVQRNLSLRITIMVYLQAISFCDKSESRNHREGAGTIGIAAVYIHMALFFTFHSPALKRGIFGNLASVALHRTENGVVECLLDLVRVAGVSAEFQESAAELHPGEADAGLHSVVGRNCLE